MALDALSREQALSELANKKQIPQWKWQAEEQNAAGFAGKAQKAQQSDEARIKGLHAKIGQLLWRRFFTATLRQNLSSERRRKIIDTRHPVFSVRRQCEILKL